jgi:hypothetical protein
LADLEIAYPYVNNNGTADDSKAAVSFMAAWATDSFPGETLCTISLVDGTGEPVGETSFGFSSGEKTSRRFGPVLAVVSGTPLEARGTCSPGSYPPGAGYVFEGPIDIHAIQAGGTTGVEAGREQTKITWLAHWTTEEYPGLRTCNFSIEFNDGTKQVFGPFNVGIGDNPEKFSIEPLIKDPETIRSARGDCHELTLDSTSE